MAAEEIDAIDLSDLEDNVDKDNEDSHPIQQHRAWIYSHFGPQENSKFMCNYCKKKLAADKSGSSGNLLKHYKKCPQRQLKSTSRQPKINDCALKSKFSNSKFHELIAENLILTNQAFLSIESPSFIRLAIYGRPTTATVPNADTVKRIILRLYDEKKKELIEKLKSHPGKFSVVVDAWTTKTSYSFHGILVCWIDLEWNFNEVLLDLDVLRGQHSGLNLAESLITVLTEFGIMDKIVAITSDNASSCDRMFAELEMKLDSKGIQFDSNAQRVRCLAHVCNLACQDAISLLKKASPKVVEGSGSDNETGLSADEEDEESTSDSEDSEDAEMPVGKANLSVYDRVRIIVSKIRNCGCYSRKYRNACAILKEKYLSLRLDVQTRWNSTFYMLKRIIHMRKPVDLVLTSFKELQALALSDSEWDSLEEMMKLLEPFEKVTKMLSKGRSPSMALTAAVYHDLFEHLEKFQNKTALSSLADAAKAAISKLNKYFPHSDELVYIAGLVLDPRCKLEWYKQAKTANEVVQKNKKVLMDLWDSKYKPTDSNNDTSEELESDLIARQMKKAKLEAKDEFRRYLAIPVVDAAAFPNILEWWKTNEGMFPNLSRMARDYLAVSATGVPIERTFSLGSDLLVPKRRCLKDQTVRKSLSLKCWLKFESRECYLDTRLQAIQSKFCGRV